MTLDCKEPLLLAPDGYAKIKQSTTHIKKLKAGNYSGVYQRSEHGEVELMGFKPINIATDNLIDLETKESNFILNDLRLFLSPEVVRKYEEFEFVKKRNTILYGSPGTGKTCLVKQMMAKAVLEFNSIILYDIDISCVAKAIEHIQTYENKTIILVYEEIDIVFNQGDDRYMLELLDGQFQYDNVCVIGTTNHISDLPGRLLRPGRFGNILEIGTPNQLSRTKYFASYIDDVELVENLVILTKNYTIDQLKYVAQEIVCFDYNIKDVIKRLKKHDSNDTNDDEAYRNYVMRKKGMRI
jgi:ATP-dependent 26S proteasome regulatory subunit